MDACAHPVYIIEKEKVVCFHITLVPVTVMLGSHTHNSRRGQRSFSLLGCRRVARGGETGATGLQACGTVVNNGPLVRVCRKEGSQVGAVNTDRFSR